MRKSAYQEKGICKECVCKDRPSDPSTSTLPTIEYLTDYNRHDRPNKFVAWVGNQIQELGIAGDGE